MPDKYAAAKADFKHMMEQAYVDHLNHPGPFHYIWSKNQLENGDNVAIFEL